MNGSQFIEAPWGASVFGTASVETPADLARLRVSVTQTRQRPHEALDITQAGVNQVREVLRTHGIPDTAASASRLNLRSSWSYGNERRLVGYESNVSFVIELRELDILETVLWEVVAAGANNIDGVEFDVSTRKELRAQARVAAVADAREKASLLAEAAGARLGPAIHIQDLDPGQDQHTYRVHSQAAQAGTESDLTPGKITVAAAVAIGFSLRPFSVAAPE
ncbi:SIMPL domain-containing protein [Streptomyces sp. NPDC058420]|uniref:SIMPL domain-containing protein n=1 Tax=Streptomyces sp. NPDC058420 TaxID=3346489 RepID=UPI003656A353